MQVPADICGFACGLLFFVRWQIVSPWVLFFVAWVFILLPVAIILWEALRGVESQLEQALRLVGATSLVLSFFLLSPWGLSSYYMRFAILGGFLLAVLRSLRRLNALPTSPIPMTGKRLSVRLTAFLAATGVGIAILAIRGLIAPENAVELAFPLRGGSFYVLQGGNSPLANPFHGAQSSDRFAVDIVKLNRWGARAGRWIPRDLLDYEVFGATVHAPCSGTVRRLEDGLPDNPPGAPDTENPPGNHVVLQCGGFSLLLAHMMNGSVVTQLGESVEQGEVIGRVGNSGNSVEPHLHVHAFRIRPEAASDWGDGVPMLFDGRFLVVNSLMRN